MLEAEIEHAVCHFAEKNGWFVRKLQWVNRRGAPDRLFVKEGRVVFIEFKSPTGKASALQKKEIQRLRDHGAEVYVINNIGIGKDILG